MNHDSDDDEPSPKFPARKRAEVAPASAHLKEVVEAFCEGLPVTIVMSLFTIWALFSDDIRLSSTEKDADLGFTIVISIAFFLFFLEMIAQCFYKDGYLQLPILEAEPNETFDEKIARLTRLGSFYFWLDLIATVSLIFEIEWIIGDALDSSNQGSLKSARAGRASRAGARAGRIVRLVRMVKLYKYFKKNEENEQVATQGDNTLEGPPDAQDDHRDSLVLQGENRRETGVAFKDDIDEEEEVMPESKVGTAMSDITTKRVIILVLVMLIGIPLLSYSAIDLSNSYGASVTHRHARKCFDFEGTSDEQIYCDGRQLSIDNLIDYTPLVRYKINGDVWEKDRYSELRNSELSTYEFNSGGVKSEFSFSIRPQVIVIAQFAIYMTLFVLVLLVVGTFYFTKDVNRLVIIPIEKMVLLVQAISNNPLGVDYKMLGEEDGFIEGMETTLLLQTINKIGSLMKVGFGEAGATVIAKNLSTGDEGSSSKLNLNLMGGGNLIESIFGFCDVRNFTDTTECLQEEVMLFVNRIAHILHSIVVQCSGSANKNIGDAFLLTWKLEQNATEMEKSALADQALLAFCKALIELCRYQDFICNFSNAATNRLIKRFPGHKVRIGSGLHVGWAIEGAIGSYRKIDASYLSPHVNMSEYLESSTKAYGVPLLLSEPFYKLLSPHCNKYCRQVDRIRRSEGEEPMGLFTYDADLNFEFAEDTQYNELISTAGVNKKDTKRKSVSHISKIKTSTQKSKSIRDVEKALEEANKEKEALEKAKNASPTITINPYHEMEWTTDMDLVNLRHLVNDNFRDLWKTGMNNYIKGDWQKARDIFHETMKSSNGQDGPSKFLIKIIDAQGGMAPHNWMGYRMDG